MLQSLQALGACRAGRCGMQKGGMVLDRALFGSNKAHGVHAELAFSAPLQKGGMV